MINWFWSSFRSAMFVLFFFYCHSKQAIHELFFSVRFDCAIMNSTAHLHIDHIDVIDKRFRIFDFDYRLIELEIIDSPHIFLVTHSSDATMEIYSVSLTIFVFLAAIDLSPHRISLV